MLPIGLFPFIHTASPLQLPERGVPIYVRSSNNNDNNNNNNNNEIEINDDDDRDHSVISIWFLFYSVYCLPSLLSTGSSNSLNASFRIWLL